MQPYDSSPHRHHQHRGPSDPGRLPAARGAGRAPERSATPIYDSLYAEYQRLFRALPGDRSGEEELRFTGFARGRGGWDDAGRSYPPPRYPEPHRPSLPAALPPAPRDGHRYG